jgi:hypothetical protein
MRERGNNMRISDMLIAIANWLENSDNEAILLAEYDENCLQVVAETCLQAAEVLKLGAETVEMMEPAAESTITAQSIDTLAEIASALDESGNPELKKSASAIDELLRTIAAPPNWVSNFKKAQEKKIDVLKQKYEDVSKSLEDQNKVADTNEALDKSPYMKEYRILEHPLNTRTCPDHPGAQMARVGEGSWQCNLDKKVYNYQTGYTNEKGDKIPGGDVAQQTPAQWSEPQSMFDTRETRLNGMDVFQK